MNVITLDKIVKNILLKRGYSLHQYMPFLVYVKDGLREISLDNLQTIRYKVLTQNDNSALEIPNDYVDYCRLSVRQGVYLIPMVEDNSLDLVPNYDSDFNIQPYSEGIITSAGQVNSLSYYNGYLSPYWWLYNWNAFGENLGRQFGGVGALPDTFRVNKARNEIKINENLANQEFVLEYISNGLDADAATHVDVYAQMTLEMFAMWQHKEHNRTYSAGEARVAYDDYVRERQILIARVSDLTLDRMKRIVQINSIAVKY